MVNVGRVLQDVVEEVHAVVIIAAGGMAARAVAQLGSTPSIGAPGCT
jgi:uncharacterized protein (DUF697 family)